MSPKLKANVKILVNGSLKLDLCLFDGEMGDWRDEHSVDLSCNLFYTSRSTPLGLRYIPERYQYDASPTRKVISMTRAGMFEIVYEPPKHSPFYTAAYIEANCRKIIRVLDRAYCMVVRDWYIVSDPVMTPPIRAWVNDSREDTQKFIWDTIDDMVEIQNEHKVEAIGLPDGLKDEIKKKLF